MASYDDIVHEVNTRAATLIQKGAGLSQADAIGAVFKQDPALYDQYRRAKPPSPTVSARAQPQASGAEAEVLARADAVVAKAAGLSRRDAISQVLAQDPGLYARYRKQAGSPAAPTFGSELLTRQMDDLYEYSAALHATVAGILRSDVGDKGMQIAAALDAFRATVLQVLQQAGLSVPTAKRAGLIPEPTEAAILKTAVALAPQDPLGAGMVKVGRCLQEIIAAVTRHAA